MHCFCVRKISPEQKIPIAEMNHPNQCPRYNAGTPPKITVDHSGTVRFHMDKPMAFIGYKADCDRSDETTYVVANHLRGFSAYLEMKEV